MKKKSLRKITVEKLDTAVSKYIRQRDGYCVQCKSGENLTNGHVFTRTSYSTRWDTADDGNCHTQCWGCNYNHGRDQWPYFAWYIGRFGMDRFEQLRREHKAPIKYTTPQLIEMLEEINELLDD